MTLNCNGLIDFLNTNKVFGKAQDVCFTHTTKVPAGKYNIPLNSPEYIEFLKKYCNTIKNCDASKPENSKLCLTEKPGPFTPLRCDIDFKAELDVGTKRQYSMYQIKKLIQLYQIEIKNLVEPSDFKEEMLYCLLLEKTTTRIEEGIIKDGFHLHFPYFICEDWVFEYMRKTITAHLVKDNFFQGMEVLTPANKMIDDIRTKMWLMYGSSKLPKAEPFLATRAFGDMSDDDLSPSDDNKQDDNDDEMIKHEISIDNLFINYGRMIDIRNDGGTNRTKYYLPRLLSIRGFQNSVRLIDRAELIRKEYTIVKPRRKPIIQMTRTPESIMEDIKLIKEAGFIDMLTVERATEYNTWIDVGWTLFNISQGSDEGLDLWLDFSRKSPRYDEEACETAWYKMEVRGRTMGSLKAIAKADNPDKYMEWKKTTLNYYLELCLETKHPNESDVAAVISKYYDGKYKYATRAKKGTWYQFSNHRWMKMDEGLAMRACIIKDIPRLFKDYNCILTERARTCGNDEQGTSINKKIIKCIAITEAIKTDTFLTKTLNMCKTSMHDPNFDDFKDKNNKLIGCENGVIDLETLIFRDGRPDDLITLSNGINYQEFTKEDDLIADIEELFTHMFLNVNRREYTKSVLSSCLEGGNPNKLIIVVTGGGGNGKSLLMRLLKKTFGKYCIKVPPELLMVSQSNSSGGCRPDLMRIEGKRIMIGDEIPKTAKLDIGNLKRLTGGDDFWARGLHDGDGAEIKPDAVLFIQVNEPPKVPADDDATWNRLRLVECLSKFVLPHEEEKFPVPLSEEEQCRIGRFKADPEIDNCLGDYATGMLWYLFDRYRYMKKHNIKLVDPPEVVAATQSYRKENDVYMHFISDKLVKCPGKNVKLKMVFDEFKTWYSDNYPSYRNKVNQLEMKKELLKFINTYDEAKGMWLDLKIKDDNESVSVTSKVSQKKSSKSDGVPKKRMIKAKEEDPGES